MISKTIQSILLFILLFLAAGFLEVQAQTQTLAQPTEETLGTLDQDMKRTELQTAIQKQMNAVSDAERELRGIQEKIQQTEKRLESAEVLLKRMGGEDPSRLSLFYLDLQKKPLTQNGQFYDQALMARDDVQKELSQLNLSLKQAQKRWEEENRKLETAKAHLQDFEQAITEGWPHNPF